MSNIVTKFIMPDGVEVNLPSQSDPLDGKNIYICGDSLMSAAGWQGGFGNILQELHPTANIINLAVNGACLTTGHTDTIFQQMDGIQQAPDILILNGGNNDVASYVEAGEMPTGAGEGDLSNLSQIYPCFSSYCNAIRTEWPTTDVYFVTSMMAGNNIVSGITGTMMYDFWQDMKKICCYYNIRVIDLSQIAGFDTRISGGSNPYMFDTFHPNEAGYRKMGPAFNHEICKYY